MSILAQLRAAKLPLKIDPALLQLLFVCCFLSRDLDGALMVLADLRVLYHDDSGTQVILNELEMMVRSEYGDGL